MSSVSANPATVPFWERLRAILAYPLQSEALLTIALLAGLRLFGMLPGLAGWILNLLITVALLRYAAAVLVASANGETDAPSGYSTPDSVGWVVLKVQILLVVLAVVTGVVGAVLGLGYLALVAPIAIALGTPAALMYAAIDQDTLGALNPMMWLQTVARIGWPYIVAALLCVLILYSEANAKALTLPFLPGPLAIVGHYFIAHYATIVTFHLLGYLVYQYRNELGFEIAAKPQPLARRRDRDQNVLDESERLAAEGNTAGAAQLLGEHIAERGGTDAVHKRYRKLLTLHDDTAALAKHSRDYLNVQIAHDRWRPALDFWAECRAADGKLWPSDPSQVLELVDKAHELGRPELALKFASGFSREHPTHLTVPAVHLGVAKALLGMGKRDEARKLLEVTKAAYPKSKTVPAIEQFLAGI